MIKVSQAVSRTEIEEAKSLITRVYLREKYIRKGESSSISSYIGTPFAITYIARVRKALIGTVTLVIDSAIGLPMDALFSDELWKHRRNGKLGEVCQFAVDWDMKTACQSRDISEYDVTLRLLAECIQAGLEQRLSYLCFTINPKHRKFYEMLGSVCIGDTKSYSGVNGAPALSYFLEMSILFEYMEKRKRPNFLVAKILNFLPKSVFSLYTVTGIR
jgi:hypothetical protein